MSDAPVVLLLVLLIGAGIYVVRQAGKKPPAPKPHGPAGEPYIPLAPQSVDPSMRWLLLPSQEN